MCTLILKNTQKKECKIKSHVIQCANVLNYFFPLPSGKFLAYTKKLLLGASNYYTRAHRNGKGYLIHDSGRKLVFQNLTAT